MDGDSPASTVERTFWTVWNYITEAVNRFFRPEPTNIVRNDPNSLQESAIDSKPAKSGHTEGDAIAREGDEEQHLASVSVLSISHATVAWEHCTTDIDLGPDEGSVQHKTQSTGSESKEPEEDEGMREEPFGQTGSDEAEALITECTKENEQEESGVQNTQGQDEAQENDDYEEDVNSTLLSLTGDAVSKYVEESGDKAGAEEETERVMTPDEHQKMDETMTKEEEGDEDEDKQCLEEEDIEVKLCRIKDLSLEEEGNLCIEETRMQRAKVDTAPMLEEVENSDGVLLLASENENKSDEGAKQAENQPSVCEELPADHGDFTGEPILTSLHVELQMACDKSAIVSEDELIVVAQEDAMAHRGESEKVEDAKRKADESTLREQGADFEGESASEAANKQIIYEAPGQEDNIKSVKEDSQEKQISTGHVACSEEVVQNAQTELHTAECADGHQEDVAKDTEGQTKTETDDVETESHEVIDVKSGMTTRDVSVDESFSDKDKTEEVRLSSKEGNKDSYMEVACTTTSVTVKPEGEIRQEISEEFKNISLEMCEGRLVLSRELNSPACEETHEGVPEYNNESGPGENTTQRFLEIGDWKEIPATQLPEEVESKESECLQNGGWSADSLLVREYMEEEQDRTEDIKNSFDLVVEEHTEIVQLTEAGLPQETEKTLVEPVIQESGVLFGEEEANILVASMKTAIEYSEKEFELDVGLTDDTDKTTKELQDGTEELLVEYEIDEGSCESKEADTAGDGHETTGDVAAEEVVTVDTLTFLEAEVHNDREMSFFQASVDAINTDQNSYRTTSLQEVFIKSGFLEELVESDLKLLEDSAVEMQDAGIDLQEEEAAEDEVQDKNEMELSDLHVAGTEAEVTTERSEKENTLTVESVETQNQLSGEEALELSSEETETEDKSITAESKPEDLIAISAEEMEKHVTESEQEASCAEETVSSISEHQDVIDQDILDLWIQTVSEDADDVKQQERSEPGHEMDMEIEPSDKEQGGISSVQTEKDEELVESNSGESELVTDTEMSSSTAESGFSDQSVGEWGTQNSETQLLKSTSTGSVQGVYDMLANMSESADISELSAQLPESNSESQDILMEGTTETRQSYLKEEESSTGTEFHPDSGVTSSETRRLDEESDQSQEKTDEESGSQTEIDVDDLTRKTDWKEPEEADIKSVTEMSVLFKVDETKVEDEPRETTTPDSPDEIKHTEASLLEGIVSMESHSEGNIRAESEETLLNLPSLDQPQPIWSENVVDSLLGPNRVDMGEQLMTSESEDQMEVDALVLDCTAQRSRIAVKNPRVRPPKDPRSLLHMPSLEPTPSSHVPVKVPVGVPLGGLGIGIKLPGLGAGFPVLKKTQRVVRDENSQTTLPQEPETKPMEASDTPKQDEAQRKPKWMPPGHTGFGNPLMSELKNKLKKTTKE